MLVGLGDEDKITKRVYRAAASLAVQQLRQRQLSSWVFDLHLFCADAVVDVADCLFDGALLELYRFERYKSADPTAACSNAADVELCCAFGAIAVDVLPVLQQRLNQRQIVSTGVCLARDLVNEPSNVKTPIYLAQTAWQLAQDYQLTCTLLGPAELERQGFGALLAVAKGSICEPRLIVLEYKGAGDGSAPIALVGKGVTFDSGGISLKPGEGMDQMKMDMAGGAAVLATMSIIAQLQLPINVIGVVPAVENMPSGSATRPGDIVTSLSGQTIEILNTDAEGRLILADALAWVGKKSPAQIIDLATLTGACILALGHHTSAVLGNDDSLAQALCQAGEETGERLWQLPLFAEYAEQIKSQVADMKNIGGRPAGTITAAAFLQKFVGQTPWAHLDIAGTAWEEKGKPGQPSGATGFGVRLLVEYLQSR
jgi:leucyl aminopeptidase